MDTQYQTQWTYLVEEAVLEQMRARASFTALDVSNALKADRYPARHRQVAEIVREIFQSGAMDHYDYTRQLIPVVTDGGTRETVAYLYYPRGTRPEEYVARDQDALPPVADEWARDVADTVPAGMRPPLSRSIGYRTLRSDAPKRTGTRRDGALPIPRRLLDRLGWIAGKILGLLPQPGNMTLSRKKEAAITVRVWDGPRLRICKTKLRLGGLVVDRVSIRVHGDNLLLESNNEIKGDQERGK